ncbi:hypothetical protein [Streptomyces sp. NBC_00105]|uniref:hypothetical protein n=1 Tax=Streptomyces sp. NBC_00105 TaxID=2903622 RepID=UPI00325568AB
MRDAAAADLIRFNVVPAGTPLAIAWQRPGDPAAAVDAWLDTDPAVRRDVRWADNPTPSGYLTWAVEPGTLYTGSSLIREMAAYADITLTGYKRTFDSAFYLILPGGVSLAQLRNDLTTMLTRALGA